MKGENDIRFGKRYREVGVKNGVLKKFCVCDMTRHRYTRLKTLGRIFDLGEVRTCKIVNYIYIRIGMRIQRRRLIGKIPGRI